MTSPNKSQDINSVPVVEPSAKLDITFGDFDQRICPTTKGYEDLYSEREHHDLNRTRRTSGPTAEPKKPSTKSLALENPSRHQMAKQSGDMNERKEARNSRPNEDNNNSTISHQLRIPVNTAPEQADSGSVDRSASYRNHTYKYKEIPLPVPKQKAALSESKTKTSRNGPEEDKPTVIPQLTGKPKDKLATSDRDNMSSARANPRGAAKTFQNFTRADEYVKRYPASSSSKPVDFSYHKGTHQRNYKHTARLQRNRKQEPEVSEESDAYGKQPADGGNSSHDADTQDAGCDPRSGSKENAMPPSKRPPPANAADRRMSTRKDPSSTPHQFPTRNDTSPKSWKKRHSEPKRPVSQNESSAASRFGHENETDTPRGMKSRFSKKQAENRSAPRSQTHQTGEDMADISTDPPTDQDAGPVDSRPKTENITMTTFYSQNRKSATPDSSSPQNRKPHNAQKSSKLTSHKDQKGAEHVERSVKQPMAKETKLFIRVHQEFDDIQTFASFLDGNINPDKESIQPKREHVSFRNGFTFCTLVCPSKNKASKVMQNLTRNKRKSDLRLDCSFNEFPRLVNEKEHKQEQRNLFISETKSHFDSVSEIRIRKSKLKDESIQKRIDGERKNLKNLRTHDAARQTIKQLEQEQLELQQLVEEFKASRDQLKTQLQSVHVDNFSKEIKLLKNRFKRECDRMETALPIYGKRQEIVRTVQENQVTIILGETGSGKSTQLVQYLDDSGHYQSGLIVCTQPRRVAATSLATRVAKEMGTRVGEGVGYQLGSKSKQSSSTHVLYTTDHSLLNECLTDPELKRYSCIIVDEAHERSLHTDLLLSMIKKCLANRPELKVIITSATIDPSVFQDYFGQCPILEVTGRVFPVEVVWSEEVDDSLEEDYLERAVNKVLEIHAREPEGDILVFVTSPAETEKCSQLLSKKMENARGAFKCFQLHGKQQSEEQQKVFETLRRTRKIVFATNCAETSLTIDGIRYVVDTGLSKEMCYDPRKNLNALRLSLISQSSANQRKGRAGRTAPGKCYRLFSENIFEGMQKVSLPEILRIHLGHALLKLAELGVSQTSYDFVQSPSEASIRNAIEMLNSLGALEDGKITKKGLWIAKLPFDPRLGLLTYLGHQDNLLDECIVLAAVMSAEGGVFYRGSTEHDQRIHDITKTKFSTDKGDGLASLAVYKSWLTVPDKLKNEWCRENGLNAKALRGVRETIHEVRHLLKSELPSQAPSEEDTTEQLRRMIFTCYAINLCHHLGQESAGYFAAHDSCRVHIHPSSCLNTLGCVPEWVVYDQVIQTSRDFIINVTPVEEAWLEDLDTRTLGFNVEQIRKKTVKATFSICVGSRAFSNIVGPCFANLRELEASFSTADSLVFIDANRDQGQINAYSTEETDETDQLRTELETIKENTIQQLEEEDRERSIAGPQKKDIRVVLGKGGLVDQVLMPKQTRKVFVNKAFRDTEDDVREKFSRAGDVKFCRKFDKGPNWGFLIFKTPEQAEEAARSTAEDRRLVGKLERREDAENLTRFRVILKWCWRPCRGFAIVHMSRQFFSRCLHLRTVYVDAVAVTITAEPKHRNYLYRIRLSNITHAMTEDLIGRSLLHALHLPEQAEGIILDIHLPRFEPAIVEDKEEEQFEHAEFRIQDFFQKYSQGTEVDVIRPKPDDAMVTAVIWFEDPAEGFAAFEKLRGSADVRSLVRKLMPSSSDDDDGGDEAELAEDLFEMTPRATACMHIPDQTLEQSEEDLQEAIRGLKEQNVRITIEKDDEHDDRNLLTMTASCVEKVVQARACLDSALKGYVVPCGNAPLLFSEEAGDVLAQMEQETGARIEVDKRLRRVTIRGPPASRAKMGERIQDLIQAEEDWQEHSLRGDGRPPGLMKALVVTYTEHLTLFLQVTGLQDAAIDFRRQKLKVTGCPKSLQKASDLLQELTEEVWRWNEDCGRRMGAEPAATLCSVCLCPIPSRQLYRLNLCAHPYCKDCLQQQVRCAIASATFPVECCADGCSSSLALCDLLTLTYKGHVDLTALTKAAVKAYLTAHSQDYHFCPTSDCPAVYKVIQAPRRQLRFGRACAARMPLPASEAAEAFVCPACGVSTCRRCHEPSHGDQPCASSGEQPDEVLEAWAAEDEANRKRCPRCNSMIERKDGCLKMTCAACRVIFCFVCCDTFDSTAQCYDHLVAKHGGIFPANYQYDGRRVREVAAAVERANARLRMGRIAGGYRHGLFFRRNRFLDNW